MLADYKKNLTNQMSEIHNQYTFKREVDHNTYMELMKLEEEQVELEKKLIEQKRAVMKQHLIKTINENKVKIEEKRNQLAQVKEKENKEIRELNSKLEEELKQQQEDKIRRKHQMKNEMVRQLQAQKKKAEDN